jgi:hypothetical protein
LVAEVTETDAAYDVTDRMPISTSGTSTIAFVRVRLIFVSAVLSTQSNISDSGQMKKVDALDYGF